MENACVFDLWKEEGGSFAPTATLWEGRGEITRVELNEAKGLFAKRFIAFVYQCFINCIALNQSSLYIEKGLIVFNLCFKLHSVMYMIQDIVQKVAFLA